MAERQLHHGMAADWSLSIQLPILSRNSSMPIKCCAGTKVRTSVRIQRWLLNSLLFAISTLLALQFVLSQRLIFPFDAPDERVHFARAHDVALAPGAVKISTAGGKVAVGAFFYDPKPIHDCYGNPNCLRYKEQVDLSRLRLDQFFQSRFQVGYAGSDNSLPYAGSNYMHLIPWLLFSQQFHLDVFASYLGARVSSGLVYLCVSLLLILSIRAQWASGLKNFFTTLIGLGFWLPSSVFLSNSVSGDFLITVAAVVIAMFLLSSAWRLPGHIKQLLLCAQPVLYFILLGKLPYAPLAITAFIMTWKRFRQARTIWFVVMSVFSVIFPFWWYLHSRSAVLLLFKSQRGEWVGGNLSPSQWVDLVKGSLFSLFVQFGDLYRQLVAVLGNGPVSRLFLPKWFYIFHGILLIALVLAIIYFLIRSSSLGDSVFDFSIGFSADFFILFSSVTATYLMICYGLRMYWSNTYPLDGLQGRYFLPLLPFMVLALEAWLSAYLTNSQSQLCPELQSCLNHRLVVITYWVLLLVIVQLSLYVMNILYYYSNYFH